MTTSILNKITAALSLKSSISNCSEHKKNDTQDEYHTIFTKRLPSASNFGDMNSANCYEIDEVDHHDQSACSLDDFIEGPIDDDQSINLRTKSSDSNRSITATPADSSCGFHNTFSVLEKNFNKTKHLKLSQQQIEYLLEQNKDLSVRNDESQYVINDRRRLHALNNLFNSSMNDANGWSSDDEEPPSQLELELEAMDRLRSMWNEEILTNSKKENDEMESSVTPFDSSLIEEFYQQDNYSIGVSNSNEYIYHVAKSRDGQLYIRVRRNLRLDQGKWLSSITFSQTIKLLFRLYALF